jgi:hypothetical protein
VKTSLPDFHDKVTLALVPINLVHHFTTPLPNKDKLIDEHLRLALDFDRGFHFKVPRATSISTKTFIQQYRNYRSHFEQPFFLLI